MNIAWEQILAILGIVATASVSVMTYINNKRDVETRAMLAKIEKEKAENSERQTGIDATKIALDNANKVYEQINELYDRIKTLNEENSNLRKQFAMMQSENTILKDRLVILEKTFLDNPIYNTFFKLTKFACCILNVNDGTFFDINQAFSELYGYTEYELNKLSIFDLTLQRDETRTALDAKQTYIPDRLHRNKIGQSFLVEIHVTYHDFNGQGYAFCIYLPKVKTTLASRIHDMLMEIIANFDSDYSTVWVLHNHGQNKLSGIFETVKRGNAYLFQDYRRIPSTIFSDLFEHLIKNKYIVLHVDDNNFDSVRASLKHADLETILLAGVFDNDQLIGMLSTSWRNSRPSLSEQQINSMIKYAQSNVLCEAITNEIVDNI